MRQLFLKFVTAEYPSPLALESSTTEIQIKIGILPAVPVGEPSHPAEKTEKSSLKPLNNDLSAKIRVLTITPQVFLNIF